MHTAGEPLRIVVDGYPPLTGDTILAKRRDAMENHDHLRRILMLEPRGHAEMYGAIVTEPCDPRADAAVLFMHNSGYSTMCGHATIALGRYLIDQAIVPKVEPKTDFVLECPCGPVSVSTEITGGRAATVSFESIPCFADRIGATTQVPGIGALTYDIGFGGAYYAIFPASEIGVSLATAPMDDLHRAACAIICHLRETISIQHPDDDDLAFLYGAIITDEGAALRGGRTRNLCVFGDGQVDRSPTGSGISARIAVDAAKGSIKVSDEREFAGLTNQSFVGKFLREKSDGIIVGVSGTSFYTGKSSFVVEANDPLGEGFGSIERLSDFS
ncbi:MAG: proline racemase [Marinicaulis sp.]|nr:proline racemase [Marinicaulis sp.]